MELRRYRGLYESGAISLSEIAKETGLNRRTVRKYLSGQAPVAPPRRAANHGEVIGLRAARDHMALRPLPQTPYVVTQRHLRPVGKDCLVAFAGNLYSVPARKVRPRQLIEVRATKPQVMLHSTIADATSSTLLATHPRAVGKGTRVVDEEHWGGLPDGKNRHVTTGRHRALTSPRGTYGRGSRVAAGPADPGRGRQHPGRPPPAVGL
ncbi:Mu transposase domain-containing protein [Streptomyces flaveolus]|uniref:Mu transposase domain-containing protein n=1 Tax=Streptomyces flaveolus TaxID=67297 RepID=UPI003F572ECD